MTRVLGIVGGIGPESTIDYYRSLLSRYQARTGRDNNPRVIIHSVDLRPLLDALAVDDLEFVASCFTDAIESLARAGADLALLAANTAHIVFPTLVERSPLPLLSIVEATYAEARNASPDAPRDPRHGLHDGVFRLSALDAVLATLPEHARRRDVEIAMEPHVLAQAVLMGTCERPADKRKR